MWRLLLTLLLLVVGVGLLLWVALLVTLRTKFRPGLDAIRRVNRSLWNPRAMRMAGGPDAYAVICHVGRRSGRLYETPIGAVEAHGGFLVGLPYGTRVDWLQNILVARSAELRHEGRAWRVTDPELLSEDEARPLLSGRDRLVNRIYGVEDFLWLTTAGPVEVVDSGP